MSEKFYTPEEVARQVLAKVMETYKNSNLAKSNTSHEIESGSEPINTDAEAPEHLTGKNLKGVKKTKQHAGRSENGEQESEGEQDEENQEVEESAEHEAAEAVDEHNEDMHGEPEDVDSAFEEEEESEEESENEKKKPNPFMKKGLDSLKEFLIKREEIKMEKSEKDKIKGINKPMPFQPGMSEAGFNVMHNNKGKGHPSFKEEAKEKHKKVLQEQKEMKKPNLPKSECESEPTLQKECMKKGGEVDKAEKPYGYSEKNPKIDVTHKGKYHHSTNFATNLKQAKEAHLKRYPDHKAEDVKAFYDREKPNAPKTKKKK